MYASKIGVRTAQKRIDIISRNFESAEGFSNAAPSTTAKSEYEGFEAMRNCDVSIVGKWTAKFRRDKAHTAVRELMAVPNEKRRALRGNMEHEESLIEMMCEAIATADVQDINDYVTSGLVDVNAIFDTSATYGVPEGFLIRPIRNCTFLHLAALVDNIHIMRTLCNAKADPVQNSGTYFAGANLTSRLIPSEPAQGPVVTVVDMARFVNASTELMTYLDEQIAASTALRSLEEKWIEPWDWESSQPARQQRLHVAEEEFLALSEPGSTRSSDTGTAYVHSLRARCELIRELADKHGGLTAYERGVRKFFMQSTVDAQVEHWHVG